MRSRGCLVVLLAAALATACAEPEVPEPLVDQTEVDREAGREGDAVSDDGAEDGPGDAPATVAGIEELGHLTLPEAASDVEVGAVGETSSRRAVFTLPTEALEPWCRDLGLGQPLVRAAALEPEDRERFGIPDDAEVGDVRTCEGSAPDDPRVQRAVIATGAERDEVTVHLVVEVFPLR